MLTHGIRVLAITTTLALVGCQHPGQNVYSYREVGRANLVNFGTVLAVRDVAIEGQNTGGGALVGATGGGIAGSQFGRSGGNAAATLAGVAIGLVAGALIEQAAANRTGLEYTVTLETGVTMTIVQEKNDGDRVLQPGERVMVQLSSGTQRVLPTDNIPTEIKRPQGVKVVD